MKKFIAAIILVVCTYSISAQKLDKVRTVDKEKKELSDEDLKKKKKYIINLINLGYNDKTIRLKTSASKNQIKAIRKEIGM
tara:strand:+ start:407 stop:649 length:243 start_codon:yes stop_codon:yes gene_type:complete